MSWFQVNLLLTQSYSVGSSNVLKSIKAIATIMPKLVAQIIARSGCRQKLEPLIRQSLKIFKIGLLGIQSMYH